MAEFRFRNPGTGLSANDEAAIRRYLEDENKKREEINRNLPPGKPKLLPVDVDFTVYGIATGDPKKRDKLLGDIRTRNPAPPISDVGISVETKPVVQTPQGVVTTDDAKLQPPVSEQKQASANPPPTVPATLSWEQQRNKIASEVKAENEAKRDEVLRAQGKNPATASMEELVAANKIVNDRGEYKSINAEVKKQIGDPPQPTVNPSVITQRQEDLQRQVEQPPKVTTPDPPVTANNIQVVDNQVSTSLKGPAAAPAVSPNTGNADKAGKEDVIDQRTFIPWGSQGIRDITVPNNQTTHVDIGEEPKPLKPRPNPLDDYANYTYGLRLCALTVADFNSIVENPNSVREKTRNVLIASGGRRSADMVRSKNFSEDFFFDNFKMTTVIGLNARGRGSNVIEMSFNIIEPYGITLVNRLLKEAETLGISRWDEMPFVMIVDFYGNTDAGQLLQLTAHTKYLPIRIIELKVKLTAQGTEYQATAVPYNHQAFSETAGVTPVNLEVKAKTVQEFFDSQGDDGKVGATIEAKTKAERERSEKEISDYQKNAFPAENADQAISGLRQQSESKIEEIRRTRYAVGSYAAAINEYYSSLKAKGVVEEPDTFNFVIDSDISKAFLTTKDKQSVRTTPMAKNAAEQQKINMEKLVNPINAGTSIIEVIKQTIQSSTYIVNQIDLQKESSSLDKDKPLSLYKIIPKLKLGKYDNKRKTHQKLITYHVKKFLHYNTKYPFANQSNPSSWVKQYDYIFTGNNKSIIDLNIDFNTAFYIAIQSYKGKVEEVNGASLIENKNVNDPNNTTSATPENTPISRTTSDAAQLRIQPRSGTDEPGANKNNSTDGSNDLFKSVLSSARGDMINIQMKIIGDPEFIKQDDLLYVGGQTVDRYIDQFGSIVTDAQEIFVYLNFRTPSDLDQNRGLMDFTTWQKESSFNGIYRVIQVTNEFTRGQFTQTLDLIRQFQQEDKRMQAQADANVGRSNPSSQQTGAQQRADQQAEAEQASRLEKTTAVPTVNSTSSSAIPGTETSNKTSDSPVSGTGVQGPGPRVRPDEVPLERSSISREIKQGFDTLKSKISGVTTPIGEATNKFGRAIFAPDPNAPPYTGDDPIVRARLGLPPITPSNSSNT